MGRRSGPPHRGAARRGAPPRVGSPAQALVELAIAPPILILLVAGVLELGRGYSYAVATSDAARDGARAAAGKTATTNGPGIAAMCDVIKADLVAVSSSVSCATQVGHAPPFVAGTDYSPPPRGHVVVLFYCAPTPNSPGTATPPTPSPTP